MDWFIESVFRMGRRGVVAMVLGCMGGPAVYAGTVWTVDGKSYEGSVTVAGAGQVKIAGAGGHVDSVDLKDILYVGLNAPLPAESRSAYLGSLSLHDVGESTKPGEAVLSRGIYALAGDGAGLSGAKDGFHLVGQGIYGNGEVSARIDDVRSEKAVAGIMLRESAKPDARQASLMVTHGNKLHLCCRAEAGKDATDLKLGQVTLPLYLKLARSELELRPDGQVVAAGQLRAFTSADGAEWTLVAGADPAGDVPAVRPIGVTLPTGTLGGLVLAGGDAVGSATFDQVIVREAALPGASQSSPHAARYRTWPQQEWMKGVLLGEGTFLAGGVVAGDGAGWKISWQDRQQAVDPGQIARIQMEPISPVMLARLPQDSQVTNGRALAAGVLLASGDYLSGSITAFEPNRIELNNVILGLSSLAPKKVTAVAFRREHVAPGDFRIQLLNGSVLMAREIEAAPNGDLQLDESFLGRVVIPASQVQSVQRGLGVVAATDLAWSVDGPVDADVDAITCFDRASSLWLGVNGGVFERRVVMPGGVSISCRPPAGTRMFEAAIGVPARLGAQAKVQFLVVVDGKEAYRSAVLGMGDKSVRITVPVTGAEVLTLRVENGGGGAGPIFGLWANPLLVP